MTPEPERTPAAAPAPGPGAGAETETETETTAEVATPSIGAAEARRHRTARIAIGAAMAMVAALGVLAVTDRTPGPDRTPVSTEAVELHGDVADDLLRSSNGLGGSSREEVPDVDAPVPVAGPDPGANDRPPLGGMPFDPAPGPAGAPTTPGRWPVGLAPGGATTNASAGPAPGPGPAPETTLPRPFYLPGEQDAPVIGPMVDHDHDDEEEDLDLEVEEPSPDDDPPPEPLHEPEAPERDEEGCPNLELYPIGGFVEGAPDEIAALSPKFRALAPAEWANPTLVCGYPLEPWRDLVVQRLVAGGEPDGALITAADGSSIVLRVNEIEWATYRFRHGGGPVGPNLVGYPVDRMQWGTVGVIRTTNGGLVFAHPGAMGVPLLGGAWDRWIQEGGPDGPMGLPIGRPESATGPIGADVWAEGLPATGARQDFAGGWLFLPGVLTDVEAVAQPADRYEWHDLSELGPLPAEPIDYRGHIMQISGISFYVDTDGIRHWIPTTGAWSCAHWDLRATEYRVRGYELLAYPLGDEFVCDDYKDEV